MATNTTIRTDDLRAFFRRVSPHYREAFNMAHAICGNYELAEYAVQSALLLCYRRGVPHSRSGLRDAVRATVRTVALEQARLIDDAEPTWDGFCQDAIDGAPGDVVLQLASQEGREARRMLILRYGCALRNRDIAYLTGAPQAQVRDVLTRFERRLKRRLPPRERARAESRACRSARAWLAEHASEVPDPGAVYRGLEAELMEGDAPRGSASRVVWRVLSVLLAILAMGIFWLVMVLLQPPELEQPTEVNPSTPTAQAATQLPAEAAQPTPAPDAFAAVEDV